MGLRITKSSCSQHLGHREKCEEKNEYIDRPDRIYNI